MTVNSYDLPNDIQIDAAFSDAAGAAVDPTAVVCIVTRPDGEELGYYYGGLVDQGAWDAGLNEPPLANGIGTAGHYYSVSGAGSVDFGSGARAFAVGDWVFYNGKAWRRLPGPPAASITKVAAGAYRLVQFADIEATWKRRWESVGSIAGDGGSFQMRAANE